MSDYAVIVAGLSIGSFTFMGLCFVAQAIAALTSVVKHALYDE